MIVLIDNYDSFTYNLYQIMGEYEEDIKVIRNDQITGKEILALKPDKVVLSPGPKTPSEAGNCLEIVKTVTGKIPLLGVCLGHQSIGQAFGGDIIHAESLYHGKSSKIYLEKDKIFEGIDSEIEVGRYHSLIVKRETLPDSLEILAKTEDGIIMAMKHKEFSIYGLQFHPESILTKDGSRMIKNFLEIE